MPIFKFINPKNFLLFLSSIIIFIMIYSSFSVKVTNINISIIIFVIALNIFTTFLSIKINRYSNKAFFLILILISASIYFLWNIYALTNPVSDYRILLEGADKISKGIFFKESFDKSSYFYFYNYQIGYTVYLAAFIKLLGYKLLYIKIAEALCMIATSITIYKLVEIISNKDAAAIASILYAMYIPNIMGSSVINNQHISTLLLCLSLYFMMKSTTKALLFAGILLGFTQILRPIAAIIIMGFSIVYIHRMLKEKSYYKYFKKYIIFLIAFIIIVKGFDIAVIKSDISPSPISKSNAKYFKFVLGLKGSGVYNIPTENARKTQVYFDLKTLNFDYNRYNEECIETIKNSLVNYKTTVPFLINKMYHFMGYTDNQYNFAITKDKINNYIFTLIKAGNVQYIFLLICALISLILKFRNENKDIDLFSLLVLGFILIHILIETQPRYRYEIYVFIHMLTGEFIAAVTSKYSLSYSNFYKSNSF
ncbi:hypothetical protein CPAST_c10480 [Clostridium pasteurianum DSM 525 = ATCC 6013]|uniref:Glycosyltransferase RgtA/B/C/D-like domain-containing protein n=2 Tax=Clostridium pasteurianum TaxID=1501 RepID=A0A0H3J5H3_CLOPA|nr:glycosyltransferase family 39 protein [Clostridium pasteurianum]AJA47148.1 hypothetical protein CPAST_c10480 [Clostridium pasteurianum DSM 525 = ATCC 6013]AJA51136.1 hypothetical protein CLPA_c10480 [Clostridium pasteurianum DSM 525 = ATCC 6013]AOZ74508.1 hypothetical protein AQ983_05075 [Clostridium pasteurianum DSM 525 = ATCC 6013]AOZ78305.1 hypothetical protein AQ984_05065 [Clostridium pasteurianum]ELP59464.1 hypothetical protein F502_09283 [Clostridium pasteurianum DSM 525 = ATCC 6013]